MSLQDALPQSAEPTGLETIGAMVGSESFKFAGQIYPNPSQFLPELFSAFRHCFVQKWKLPMCMGMGRHQI